MLRVIRLLIASLILTGGAACNENTLDPNQVLDEQLADIKGRYVGAISYWYVEPGAPPFDTTWSVSIDTFLIGIGRDTENSWVLGATIPIQALGHSKYFRYIAPVGSPSGNTLEFPGKMSDEFYFDELAAHLTARRNPLRVQGFYYRSVHGPTSYGVIYEGDKVD